MITSLPVLYLLLIIASFFFMAHKSKTGRFFLVLSGIWLFIISTPLIPKSLVKSLESKYSQFTVESLKNLPGSCDIIVLGGGHSDDKNLSPNNQLSTTALARLAEGIRINRTVPGSRLILSGYRGKSELSQSLILYRTALMLGIDSASMAMQELPSNTRMEAEEYVKNFGKANGLIIVTSDIHMPRAMILFQKAGLNPVAAPTNQIIRYGSKKDPWRWMPSSENIGMMDAVIHEYAGMLWSRVGGK